MDNKYFVKDVLGDRLKKTHPNLSCIYSRNVLRVGASYCGLKIAGQPSKAVAGGPVLHLDSTTWLHVPFEKAGTAFPAPGFVNTH